MFDPGRFVIEHLPDPLLCGFRSGGGEAPAHVHGSGVGIPDAGALFTAVLRSVGHFAPLRHRNHVGTVVQAAGHQQHLRRDAAGYGIVPGLDVLHGHHPGGVHVFSGGGFHRFVGCGTASEDKHGRQHGQKQGDLFHFLFLLWIIWYGHSARR